VAARSHPDLLVVERTIDQKTERLRSLVRVEDARQASHFFSLSPAMGGWRVCIVDAADDLGSDAANSLLKMLEEPPTRSVFLMVAHAPGRLLATIRSRSIRLDLKPLATEQVVTPSQARGARRDSPPPKTSPQSPPCRKAAPAGPSTSLARKVRGCSSGFSRSPA
jgi:DNA polymerase III delta prime subunit